MQNKKTNVERKVQSVQDTVNYHVDNVKYVTKKVNNEVEKIEEGHSPLVYA